MNSITAPNQFVETRGRRLAYRSIGEGKPIILCTRFRGNMDLWDPLFLDTLAARGLRVITFDYSGLGLSTGDRSYSPPSLARDAHDLIEGLDLKGVVIDHGSHSARGRRRIPRRELVRAQPAAADPSSFSRTRRRGTHRTTNTRLPWQTTSRRSSRWIDGSRKFQDATAASRRRDDVDELCDPGHRFHREDRHRGRRGEAGSLKIMERTSNLLRRCGALLFCSLLAAGCGSSPPGDHSGTPPPPPVIESFTSAAGAVHVGESTQLTAVFSGDSASIDGIGPVESGVPVATPALARTTTFTLTVRRGPQQVEARLSIAATYRDRFRQLAPAPVAYTQHVAMALADGGALVMGGNTSESPNVPDTDTSRRFDPVAETMLPGPQLAFSANAGFTMPVELDGGAFLLVGGGINSGTQLGGVDGLRATQVFDATTGRFGRVGDLNFRHHMGGTATALGDGSVLVAGGDLPGISAAERYDPASARWATAGNMATARRGHTATRLADGRVLIAGGVTSSDMTGEILVGTAEIYDPASGGFQPTGSMATTRAFHAATLLPDGRVLVTGGFVAVDGSTTESAEVYDPSTGHFSPAGAMQVSRMVHSAILLTDGRVLVLGGLQAAAVTDIFEPTADRWSPGPILEPAWGASTATLLRNGKVLVFGGEDASGFPVSTVMLYE